MENVNIHYMHIPSYPSNSLQTGDGLLEYKMQLNLQHEEWEDWGASYIWSDTDLNEEATYISFAYSVLTAGPGISSCYHTELPKPHN
jgi:hypothetical protein